MTEIEIPDFLLVDSERMPINKPSNWLEAMYWLWPEEMYKEIKMILSPAESTEGFRQVSIITHVTSGKVSSAEEYKKLVYKGLKNHRDAILNKIDNRILILASLPAYIKGPPGKFKTIILKS